MGLDPTTKHATDFSEQALDLENSGFIGNSELKKEAEFQRSYFEVATPADKVGDFQMFRGIFGHDELLEKTKNRVFETLSKTVAPPLVYVGIDFDNEFIYFIRAIDYGQSIHRCEFSEYLEELVSVSSGEESDTVD